MDGYIGEIRLFAANFEPTNWTYCHGQTIAITANTALFSLIGTKYGGNGTTTFMLPDTRSRVVMGVGTGAGLTPRALGAIGGAEKETLTLNQMPSHYHILSSSNLSVTVTPGAYADSGTQTDPTAGVLALHDDGAMIYNTTPDGNMAASAVNITGTPTASNTGGGLAHNNIMPVNTLHYIICLTGTFPSRS